MIEVESSNLCTFDDCNSACWINYHLRYSAAVADDEPLFATLRGLQSFTRYNSRRNRPGQDDDLI